MFPTTVAFPAFLPDKFSPTDAASLDDLKSPFIWLYFSFGKEIASGTSVNVSLAGYCSFHFHPFATLTCTLTVVLPPTLVLAAAAGIENRFLAFLSL